MRLYIDLDSLSLVEPPGFRSPVQALRFKRGDGVPLELQFYRGNEAVVLPAGTVIHLAAKQRNDFHGEELISCDNFQTHPATGETVYASTPAINREPLTQIFSPANATPPIDLVLMAEISWRTPGKLPITTATFDLIVSNDIIKDDIEYFAKFTANIAAIYRTVIRSSRISQADALEKARRAAVDLCLNVAQDPTFLELPYPYQVRTYEERIIRILFSGDSDLSHKIRGPEIGRITENRYCAEVQHSGIEGRLPMLRKASSRLARSSRQRLKTSVNTTPLSTSKPRAITSVAGLIRLSEMPVKVMMASAINMIAGMMDAAIRPVWRAKKGNHREDDGQGSRDVERNQSLSFSPHPI